MNMAAVRPVAAVEFGTAHEAERRVAGVPVAARILRELARAGFAEAWIAVSSGESLDPSLKEELRRLAPDLSWHLGSPPEAVRFIGFPPDRLIPAEAIPDFLAGKPHAFRLLNTRDAPAEILRRTGKATDGVVSRWLNRPISRRLSVRLLDVPGMKPIHASLGTALIAVAMFTVLVFGGRAGLITGAVLFQAASVFDGVDGEIARATFRTSRAGAALDSAIDAMTNIAAMLGLAINLAQRGQPHAVALVVWGLAFLVLGLAMIGRRSYRDTGSVSFDGVKTSYRGRLSSPFGQRLMVLATLGTSRDFCALFYLALVLAGIPIVGLYLFALVTPVWIVFVAVALWPYRPAPSPARST